MKVELKKYGEIDKDTTSNLLSIISSCYKRFKTEIPKLDVLIFENTELLKAFKEREENYLRLEKNIGLSPISPESAVYHHAWFGTPTIIINLEKYFQRADLTVSEGELIRSVVHSILHGKKEFYFIPQPKMFLRLNELEFYLPKIVDVIFYVISSAVKGWEVSKYLIEKDNERYSIHRKVYLYHLRIGENEKTAWNKMKNIFDIGVLLFVNTLKVLMESAPFAYEKGDEEIKEKVEKNLELIPYPIKDDVHHFLTKYLNILRIGNTYENLEMIAPRIVWFAKNIKRAINDFTL